MLIYTSVLSCKLIYLSIYTKWKILIVFIYLVFTLCKRIKCLCGRGIVRFLSYRFILLASLNLFFFFFLVWKIGLVLVIYAFSLFEKSTHLQLFFFFRILTPTNFVIEFFFLFWWNRLPLLHFFFRAFEKLIYLIICVDLKFKSNRSWCKNFINPSGF